MVDCHPKETLSTDVELRSTMIFEGWRKECNNLFYCTECPNFVHNFTIMLLKFLYAQGDILNECHPLLCHCEEYRHGRHYFLNMNRKHIYFAQSTFFIVIPL